MRFYTICTQSYLAYANVLAESLARFNDGRRLSIVLIDGDESTRLELADVVLPSELPLGDAEELHRMAAIYDVVELATALKPWAFRYFLDRGDDVVIYLDPDIQVFASLAELGPLTAEHGILLNPHATRPLPRDDRKPSEHDLLRAGTYNLGFLGVSASARPFLEWWAHRLRRDCLHAVDEGYFVDQRWIDLVPGYFDHAILRDPGYNVAYWNLPTRTVEEVGGAYFVDGAPLRFFHFSGFSPAAPHLLSKYQGDAPRVLLSDHPPLAALCREYARLMRVHGHARWSRIAYPYDNAANGVPLTRSIRRVYRDELLRQEADGGPLSLPDPFTKEGAEELVRMLREPASPRAPALSRYLKALHGGRADLCKAFPDILGGDAERFVAWVRDGGVVDEAIPDELFPAGREKSLEPGVNLYGYVFAESGTGQIGRSIVAALRAAEIPYAVIPFVETENRQEHRFADRGNGRAIYDTNLICVNADQVPVFLDAMGSDILEGRYNIGVWAWEVDDMPAWMARNGEVLDEVWGISAYTAAAIRDHVSATVRAFPLPVVPPAVVMRSRAELGLPEGFLAFFAFDFASVLERKNPLAVMEAFRRAFPREGEAHLCIKTVNGPKHVADLERLRIAAADRRDILIIDGYRAAEEQMALMNSCDVYVSLHRAEGFGLTVAEAMSLGKPVISTAWSATTELTTAANSYLVPARVIPVAAATPVYPTTARWADPDIDAAASMLRHVYENPDEAKAIGERARRDIAELHGPAARASDLRDLLDQSRRSRSRARRRARTASIPLPSTGASHAEEEAAMLMARPNPDSPSRFPWLARMWRRLMLRLIRNYWVHQREVDRAILAAVSSSRESLRLEMRSLADAVAQRIEQLDERIDASSRAQRAALQTLEERTKKEEAEEVAGLLGS